MSPARMLETISLRYRARVIATLSRRQPPAVERPEVHRDLPVLVRPVADGEDQHVPLVALDRLEALHEEPAQPVPLSKYRSRSGRSARTADGGLDRFGLRLAEGHHAQAQARAGVVVVHDPLGDLRRLVRVVPGGAAPVGAVDVEQLDADVGPVAVPAGEGDELPLVEGGVGERDQRLVQGTAVPAQAQAAEGPGRLREVEDRFEVGGIVGVLRPLLAVVRPRRGEQVGRRQLLLVPGQDERGTAVDAVDGVAGEDLARLVEDDHVEAQVGGRNWLTASGDIMKHGLIAWVTLRDRSSSVRTGMCFSSSLLHGG